IDWTLLLTVVTGTIGFRVWSQYKNRRNMYLADVTRLLYFKISVRPANRPANCGTILENECLSRSPAFDRNVP
ncbi:transmembrane protein 143-like, partial [Plakobranchus ocellatus]